MARLIVIFTVLLASTVHAAEVYVQYHVWMRGTHSCPRIDYYDWHGWQWFSETHNGCTTPFGNSWLREISSNTYPFVGTYQMTPTSTDIYRWHIRLAKAAGIDAFLVSIFPGKAGAFEDDLRDNFMQMLKIAWEEDFKLGMEGWQPRGTVASYYNTITAQIDEAVASPYASALLRIDNLPVYWFVTYGAWDTWSNVTSDLLNTRNAYWIVRGPQSISDLTTARSSLTNSAKLTRVAEYNSASTSGCVINSDFATKLSDLSSNNFLVISHGYPGFNESQMSNDPSRSGRYCLRNNHSIQSDFLSSSQSNGATHIIIESWNDFLEYTQIEPGMDIKAWRNTGQEEIYRGDPYATLRPIAAFNGVSFAAPSVPCEIVDSLLTSNNIVICEQRNQTVPRAPSSLRMSSMSRAADALRIPAHRDGPSLWMSK